MIQGELEVGRVRGGGEEQAGRKPGQLFPSDGEQSSLLASRALSLLIPPSLMAPMLTLGLILFPSWAGAPGVGHGLRV